MARFTIEHVVKLQLMLVVARRVVLKYDINNILKSQPLIGASMRLNLTHVCFSPEELG